MTSRIRLPVLERGSDVSINKPKLLNVLIYCKEHSKLLFYQSVFNRKVIRTLTFQKSDRQFFTFQILPRWRCQNLINFCWPTSSYPPRSMCETQRLPFCCLRAVSRSNLAQHFAPEISLETKEYHPSMEVLKILEAELRVKGPRRGISQRRGSRGRREKNLMARISMRSSSSCHVDQEITMEARSPLNYRHKGLSTNNLISSSARVRDEGVWRRKSDTTSENERGDSRNNASFRALVRRSSSEFSIPAYYESTAKGGYRRNAVWDRTCPAVKDVFSTMEECTIDVFGVHVLDIDVWDE